jgi:hypothetical protein
MLRNTKQTAFRLAFAFPTNNRIEDILVAHRQVSNLKGLMNIFGVFFPKKFSSD